MNVRCTRCRGDNVRNARVIVDQDTRYTTIQVQGVVKGNAVQYPQNVATQSRLAQNLTADEPRKGINWFTVFCVFMIIPYPLLMIVGSCASLSLSNGASTPTQTFSIFAAGVVGLIVVVNTKIKWGSFATAHCCLPVLNQTVFKAFKQQLMIQNYLI